MHINIQTVPPALLNPAKKILDETVEINEFLHWKEAKKANCVAYSEGCGWAQHTCLGCRAASITHCGLVLPAVAGVFALVVSHGGAGVPPAAAVRPLRLSLSI